MGSKFNEYGGWSNAYTGFFFFVVLENCTSSEADALP